MANKTLFSTLFRIGAATASNEAGGRAYARHPHEVLAQYAVTGCFNGCFYASADLQLDRFLQTAYEADAEFIAKTAVYCRERAHMKDAPALLVALLTVKDPKLAAMIFPRVIDDAKMMRNFVQFIRSGAVARRSLGSLPKRLVRTWLEARTDEQLFRASIGKEPSLVDVIRMVHPNPRSAERRAFYGYLLGKPHDAALLPDVVKEYERFKAGSAAHAVPDVPMAMLTSLDLTTDQWTAIADNASWQTVRMNLNTFARHGVFANAGAVRRIAKRLRDRKMIERARVLPHQLLSAYLQTKGVVPREIEEALHDAMEAATENVPRLAGRVAICPDISGSMTAPITGHRHGATSKMTCLEVAALFTAAIIRTTPQARVMPFDTRVSDIRVDAWKPVLENARLLGRCLGGGTDCSAPLRLLNQEQATIDTMVIISDNESWAAASRGRGTALMEEWDKMKRRNRDARLICIDLQPYGTTQAQDREDILNVGGFSDEVFSVVSTFAASRGGAGHWRAQIENVTL